MENLELELGKAAAEVGKDVAEDLIRPTSQSIGNNLGQFVDGVMGWLGYWGEKQKIKRAVYLEDYKRKITENVLGIPEENLIEPPTRIVGPAIEASKYFIEEEYCRDMFAKLIASSCDSSVASSVHPSFPEIIKQLTPLDARYLALFKRFPTYPAVELTAERKDKIVSPFPSILFDFKSDENNFSYYEQLELTKTIESLSRFGLLIKNPDVLELAYDYDTFKKHWYYNMILETLSDGSTVKMKKYRLELTQLGKDFLRCCIAD